jgi:transcriptional regulator with XRE-family HTH domain
MTQAALARAINTSERNIVRWETGKNPPRVSTVAALAEATGHSVEYFLGDEDDEEAAGMGLVADLMIALDRYVDAKLALRQPA